MTSTAVVPAMGWTNAGSMVENVARIVFERETLLHWSRSDELQCDRRPTALIDRYVMTALRAATVEYLTDSAVHYAEIPGFTGVWGEGPTAPAALADVEGALRAWVDAKIAAGDHDIPVVDSINLNVL